ncbi:hypothetical protein M1O55_03345 [Dehalococcoidia bacterium]|nr:hypothetical protein [Dehalococcoidia bacterium]
MPKFMPTGFLGPRNKEVVINITIGAFVVPEVHPIATPFNPAVSSLHLIGDLHFVSRHR